MINSRDDLKEEKKIQVLPKVFSSVVGSEGGFYEILFEHLYLCIWNQSLFHFHRKIYHIISSSAGVNMRREFFPIK